MSKLFSALKLKEIEFKNRIFVSPLCQYCSKEGMPTEWHFVHLGSRAVGGAALVFAEAAAVSPEGRITPWDNGILLRQIANLKAEHPERKLALPAHSARPHQICVIEDLENRIHELIRTH